MACYIVMETVIDAVTFHFIVHHYRVYFILQLIQQPHTIPVQIRFNKLLFIIVIEQVQINLNSGALKNVFKKPLLFEIVSDVLICSGKLFQTRSELKSICSLCRPFIGDKNTNYISLYKLIC